MLLRSINPKNNKLVCEFEEFSDEVVADILKQSELAYIEWRKTSFAHRSGLMNKLSDLLIDSKNELADIMTSEMGKPIRESRAEIEKCAWVCNFYADYAEDFLSSEVIESAASLSRVDFEPLGTILGIMPWNFPFWQVFRYVVPSLMAGNVVLLKHASNVQASAIQIEKIIHAAGFPSASFRTIVVGSKKVSAIIENPIVKAVTLTGSEKAGSIVASEAGRNIKKTVLELGGSNAFIVLDDADVEKAVEIGVDARMMNAGQSCIAAKRFILQRPIAKEFIEQYVARVKTLKIGDPVNADTDIGPLASEAQAAEVERQVEESIRLGAEVLVGNKREGAFYYPTVLVNVNYGMPVFNDEVFGPVAPIIVVDSDADAVRVANNTEFGLGVSIITNDMERANSLVSEFDDGAVFINSLVKSDPRLPFGGTKKSGYGRELSKQGIREFVNAKTVYIDKL